MFIFLDLDWSPGCSVDDMAVFIEARGLVEAKDGGVASRGVRDGLRAGKQTYRGVLI